MKKQRTIMAQAYHYNWDTADKIIENMETIVKFPTFGVGSLVKMTGIKNPETYRKAHELWLKLKDAFNAEAESYNPERYDSRLGSGGPVERREVLRSAWFDLLNGDSFGDYGELTIIIEILHDHEKLETGRILFGS